MSQHNSDTTASTFQNRASGKLLNGGRAFPRVFPRLRWQLFTSLLKRTQTRRAMKKSQEVMRNG